MVALSLTAEAESIDSEKWLFDYKLQEYKDSIPNFISRRQFNDRRKKTAGLCEENRKRIAMEMDGGEEQFFVDSKPIELCRVARGKLCKMGRTGDFSQAPDFGFCASQNTNYFGYKLHAFFGLSGVTHSYNLSKASVADLRYMKDVKHTYHDCSIYGDKGYIGADVQLDLFETAYIRLECPYRHNQKGWKPTFVPLAKARKRIETPFSQLTDQFVIIRNYAKITNGLFARIIGKISALIFLQYVNFINNKPIGRIKYALNYFRQRVLVGNFCKLWKNYSPQNRDVIFIKYCVQYLIRGVGNSRYSSVKGTKMKFGTFMDISYLCIVI